MKQILLTHGYFTMVDDEDYEYLNQWKWQVHIKKHGIYAVRNGYEKGGKRPWISMHRLIMNAQKGVLVDHKDRNGLNNQKDNLRFCSYSQNAMNRGADSDKVTSVYKGVGVHAVKGRNYISAVIRGLFLGDFLTEEDAARAYDRKAIELFGEFARTNFPISEYIT